MKPAQVIADISNQTGLTIVWPDGHVSQYSFRFLRDACPCAECEALRRPQGRNPGEPRQLGPGELLPSLRPVARLTELQTIGRYAIRPVWDDGHRAGDFTWEFLREICPCEECCGGKQSTVQ
jgi:DUF971 family protein